MIIGIRARFIPAALILAGLTTAPAQAEWFSRGFYKPVNGRVGYHMVSLLTWYTDDKPPACRGGAYEGLTGISTEGTLPPGLTGASGDALWGGPTSIEGTPRQPGDWRVTVILKEVSCGATYLGERRISVLFHIDP